MTTLPAGVCVPVIGYHDIPTRLRSSHTLPLHPHGFLEGSPRIQPTHQGVGAGGLAIAMKINEPPPGRRVNCLQRGRWIRLTQTLQKDDELFRYYGPEYHREHQAVVDGRIQVVPYRIDDRAGASPHPSWCVEVPEPRARLPLPLPPLTSWYVSGRRTGFGYDFDLSDPHPRLVLRETSWIAPIEGRRSRDMCRGLYVGEGHSIPRHTVVTSYSGPLIDQTTHVGGGEYLATLLRGSMAIDGYRHPRTHHGMAQFANDPTGSGRKANVRFHLKKIDGMELESVLLSTREIRAGEELLVSLPGHRRQFIETQPSFVVNRNLQAAVGTTCVIRVLEDGGYRPALVTLLSYVPGNTKNTCSVRWHGGYDTADTAFVRRRFRLGGWVSTSVTEDSAPIYATEAPSSHRPHVTPIVLRVSDVLVHAVQVSLTGHLAEDLVSFLCRKFQLPSMMMSKHVPPGSST